MNINKYSVNTTDGGKYRFEYKIVNGENDGISVLWVMAGTETGDFDAGCAVEIELDMPEMISGCMADYLYSPFWCRPYFGRDFSSIPENTQGLLWKNVDGSYGFLMPVCDGGYVSSLGSRDGRLNLSVKSYCKGNKECRAAVLVSGGGADPYLLINDCAKEAAIITGTKLRGERKYPGIFEYLGWCSWDAMEIWVNEAETLEKCREFKEKCVPVRWAILDDMWADVEWTEKLPRFTPHSISFKVMHASKLKNICADPERFPDGLGHCIAEVNKYGIKVGIWHPVTGYWSGLSPDGEAAKKLSNYACVTGKGLICPNLADEEKVYGFFAVLHSYLRSCGADFIKVDNQSCLRKNYRDILPIGEAAKNLHAGLEKSAGEYFGGDMINCMGMANENMFSRPFSAVSRCSDDFQPENREWFSKHIMQCAFNSLIQGQFFVSDWDMWWTDDGQAVKNSVLRAVRGGPIYISDRLGRTKPEIISPLCLADGRILRCDGCALPDSDCLFDDPTVSGKAFKVVNRRDGAVYVAAFNLDSEKKAVNGCISPAELGCRDGDYVLYEHFTGAAQRLTDGEKYEFTLSGPDDFRLFILVRITGGTAVIGIAEKFISAGAVRITGQDTLETLCDGTLIVYSYNPVKKACGADGAEYQIYREGNINKINCPAGFLNLEYYTAGVRAATPR